MKCALTFLKPYKDGGHQTCKEESEEMDMVTLTVGIYYMNVSPFYFADKTGFKEFVKLIEEQSEFKEQDAADCVRIDIKNILGIKDHEQ